MDERIRLYRTEKRLALFGIAIGAAVWLALVMVLTAAFPRTDDISNTIFEILVGIAAGWVGRQFYQLSMRKAGFVYCRDVRFRDPNSDAVVLEEDAWLTPADAAIHNQWLIRKHELVANP